MDLSLASFSPFQAVCTGLSQMEIGNGYLEWEKRKEKRYTPRRRAIDSLAQLRKDGKDG
jgi:hypothetical protein